MRQAYERVMGQSGFYLKPVKLLPQCKIVRKKGTTTVYQKARKKFLWVIPYTTWVDKSDIRWYPKESVEYFECNCGEDYE